MSVKADSALHSYQKPVVLMSFGSLIPQVTHIIILWFKGASKENKQEGGTGRTGCPCSLYHLHCCCYGPEDNPRNQDKP